MPPWCKRENPSGQNILINFFYYEKLKKGRVKRPVQGNPTHPPISVANRLPYLRHLSPSFSLSPAFFPYYVSMNVYIFVEPFKSELQASCHFTFKYFRHATPVRPFAFLEKPSQLSRGMTRILDLSN